MLYGLFKILMGIGFILGAGVGFRICRSFTWFGTFKGIIGQYLTFTIVGGAIGAMIFCAPVYLPFKDKIDASMNKEDAEKEAYDDDYDHDDDNYDYGDYDDSDSDESTSMESASLEQNNLADGADTTDAEEQTIQQNQIDYDEAEKQTDYEDETYDGNTNDGSQDYATQFDYLMDQDAATVLFTESDLNGLSPQELTYLRNSIYAYRGYIFDSSELNNFFSQYSWYSPNPTVTTEDVTATEKKNAEIIRIYQETNGLMYKPQ